MKQICRRQYDAVDTTVMQAVIGNKKAPHGAFLLPIEPVFRARTADSRRIDE